MQIHYLASDGRTLLPVSAETPLPTTSSGGGGGGGAGSDRELVVTTYRARNAFTGASVGDTITSTQIIDVTGTPTTVSTIWRNQTTAQDLAGAPSVANLELVGAQAMTDAQLRAAAVAITAASLPLPSGAATSALQNTTNTSLSSIDADLGAPGDAAATSDTGTFSLIALFKRGLTNWTTLLSRIPALVSGRMPVDGSGVTQPVSAASLPLPAGAASEATLSALNTKVPALGQAAMSASQPVVIASNQSAVPVSGPLTDAQLRASAVPVSVSNFPATQPVSGTVAVSNFPATQAVSGPLTDTQLRATAVPVSGTVTANTGLTQPLTDTQLRASAVPVSGPLTDAQLRATAVPVSATALPLPAGAATSALQTSGNTSLSNIDAKLPALASGRVPVNSSIPTSGSGTILALTTANPGTTYTAFASQACVALDIVNNTGTTIEYRRNATGTAMQIPSGAARMVIGITNANQIEVRRTDTSNTTVTLQAEAFTA